MDSVLESGIFEKYVFEKNDLSLRLQYNAMATVKLIYTSSQVYFRQFSKFDIWIVKSFEKVKKTVVNAFWKNGFNTF